MKKKRNYPGGFKGIPERPPQIPAWQCPKCGRTHPFTVPTCECGPTVREWLDNKTEQTP